MSSQQFLLKNGVYNFIQALSESTQITPLQRCNLLLLLLDFFLLLLRGKTKSELLIFTLKIIIIFLYSNNGLWVFSSQQVLRNCLRINRNSYQW